MQINLEWLRDFVDVDNDGRALAEELTTLGLEVDSVTSAAPPVSGIVVAKVLECRPHPNADKLSLCVVDDGAGQHPVVCGAPNVRAGIAAPFAPVGARLPDGTLIKAAKLRGIVSEGMLCSARELGLAEDVDGLLLLDETARAGTSLVEHLALDDAILDVDITPNRGDCFSVLGIAREIAAKRGLGLKSPFAGTVAPAIAEAFPVALEAPEACPRFALRVVRGVRAGLRSPLWMRERLRRAGVRAIHPIVDVTNYVMLELGQPLHGYDLSKLNGSIAARMARPGESLELLDGRTIDLEPDVLVIADEAGPVGLAGIMGGARTAVTPETTDVLLESAFFAPAAIAGRARRYGLHTDASLRFERGVDPGGQVRALERAAALLIEIAGGRPGPVLVAEEPERLPPRRAVPLREQRVQALLGLEIETEDVEQLLGRLGIELDRRPGGWEAAPPSYRFDLQIEEDLIEEVGRSFGYDRIPAIPGAGTAHLGRASEHRIDEDRLADLLVARGYTEVITYGFVDRSLDEAVSPDAARVPLANPITSDMDVMRSSLWPGLLLVAKQNLSRQQARLKIFEIGRRFTRSGDAVLETAALAGLVLGSRSPEHWDIKAHEADFYDLKADVEALLEPTGRLQDFRFEPAVHPALAPGRTARIVSDTRPAGWIGVLHPELQSRLELRSPALLFSLELSEAAAAVVPVYRSFSKFPAVRRDLALIVPAGVAAADLIGTARVAVGDLLREILIFDVYTGQGIEAGRKSVALGLILQGVSRTLTDKDADRAVHSVTRELEREHGATIRSQ
ncbi:MAG TPA: phenylalanine--tRNA ligase subunit beta [Gammaproteobacteria bacterium]|nr:phenylalanine--tRNA ligase subunit beta [Gammaproteobacteria bacterium]